MSQIDDLIRLHCPDGVVYRELEEIGSLYGGLSGKSKTDFTDGNARYVTYMNIYSNISVDISRQDFVKVADNERQHRVQTGDILFTGSSENPEECGMSSVLVDVPEEAVYLNSFCFGFHPYDAGTLLPEFSKYLFRGAYVRKQIAKTASGVTRFNISKKRFIKIKVPIPPLEVQKQIANILDKFTQLEAELSAELSAELEARRAQYEFYRKHLMDFDEDVDTVELSELIDFINAKPHEKLVDPDGDIALMTSKFVATQGRTARRIRSENVLTPAIANDVAMVMSDLPNGRALAKAFYVDADNKYAANQRVCLLRTKNKDRILPKFLYYSVDRNKQLLKYDSGFDQTHLKKHWIMDIKLSVPSLVEQKKIVRILDSFEELVNGISHGIPAEQAARRQQYEYYRNKLLTFQELPA